MEKNTGATTHDYESDDEFTSGPTVPVPIVRSQFSSDDESSIDDEHGSTLAERVFSPTNLGLLNLCRTPPASHATDRSTVLTMRLNMINTYLKFIIQAVLYILSALLLGTILSFTLQFSFKILVPVILLMVLQMAARNIHNPGNEFQNPDVHENLSLGDNLAWVIDKKNMVIDKAANYTVGLFQPLTRRLAQSSFLDRQLAYIPDNRMKLN